MSNIDPIEFGRVLGTLESMERALRDIQRVVDRTTALEERVTRLEVAPPAGTPSFKSQAIDKGLNTVLVAILALLAKAFGVL